MRVPRFNFDTFPMALLSIFIVLSGENWNEIFYFQHRATWDYSSVVAMIYFLALFLVGNLLLFNLFIAILLTSVCADDELDDDKRAEKEAAKQLPTLSYRFGSYGTAATELVPFASVVLRHILRYFKLLFQSRMGPVASTDIGVVADAIPPPVLGLSGAPPVWQVA